MSGTPSPKESSSSGSAASFIKVVQQLIQSDDQQIILKKMNELHNIFPVLNKINQSITNQQKLTFFMRDNNFRHKLCQKLLEQFGIQKLPTIKVQLYSTRYRSSIQEELDQADLVKCLCKFGKISFVYVDKLFAYVQFQSLISSYLAIKTLNYFEINDVLKLCVRWCKPQEETVAEQYFYAKFNSITKAFGYLQKSQKFNCKYSIYLSCPPEFKLVQKIIGPKGNNIKKIFQIISNRHKIASIKQVQKNLKLRLRGKGSGYHEGPNGEQSQQLLNFCISSKEIELYDSACAQVEKLLQKLAIDYKFQFQRTFCKAIEGIIYKKNQFQSQNYLQTKQFKLEQLPSNLIEIHNQKNKILTQRQIEQQISLRNKARKMGKYQQADQIRQRLKNKGIVLVDGCGKKNIVTTTWSYINE